MTAIGPGIRRTAHGFQAWVTVKGRTTFKRFPPSAGLREMRDWIATTRGEQLTSTSPFVKPPKGRRGQFDSDARRYLDAVKAMPSYTDRKRDIDAWIAVFGSRSRRSITSDEIAAQLQSWKLAGKAASTINHKRTALQHLYTVLDGKAAYNPVRNVPKFREPAALPRGVDYAVLERVLAELPKGKHYARALVLAYTGIPPALLKRIRESDVDYEAGTVLVPERRKGRGAPARLVPLTDKGIAAFKAMRTYDAWGSFSKSRMGAMWKAAQATAKVGAHIRVYDLRHSYGAALYGATGDLHATAELLGHSSPTLTARYALAAVPARLQAAVAAVKQSWQSPGKPSPKSSGFDRKQVGEKTPRKS